MPGSEEVLSLKTSEELNLLLKLWQILNGDFFEGVLK